MSFALPPFTPRLLAFDLDGTLIQDGGNVLPEATRAALSHLKSLGVKIALLTGRDDPPPTVRDATSPDAVATNNGGRVQVGDRMCHAARFNPTDLPGLLSHDLQAARVVLFDADSVYVDLPPDHATEPWMVGRTIRPQHEAPPEDIVKARIYHPQVAAYAAKLRASHPHLVLKGGQPPYAGVLTVTPPGADKATALRVLAGELGVPLARTVAFGDSDNDETMLDLAGFAVQVGRLPLLSPHADAQVSDFTQVGAYLTELAGQLQRFTHRIQAMSLQNAYAACSSCSCSCRRFIACGMTRT